MKITFTTGTIKRLTADLLTLRLYDASGVQVYAATIEETEACEYLMKYDSITLIRG